MADDVPTDRLPALDWMRGLVMALMAVDHCDLMCNPHHAMGDSVWFMRPAPIAAGDFLTRWATHLCAPSFAFLAGAGMALSVARLRARGEPSAAVDRHWVLRGLVLVGLEITVFSLFWRGGDTSGQRSGVMLQVLWALGGGLGLLVPLRRLPSWSLLALALLLLLAVEVLYAPVRWTLAGPVTAPAWNGLLFSGGPYRFGVDTFVLYPLLAWFPPMLLGCVFGRRLAGGLPAPAATRALLGWGTAALLVFLWLRWQNGFGNAQLLRQDDSWLAWLRCSKYPPSVTFLLMELGLMAVLLAGFTVAAQRLRARSWGPLLVLGQVPLFFYLVHMPLIGVLHLSGLFPGEAPWSRSWLMALTVVVLLWPVCWLYRAYKRRGHAWTRYL